MRKSLEPESHDHSTPRAPAVICVPLAVVSSPLSNAPVASEGGSPEDKEKLHKKQQQTSAVSSTSPPSTTSPPPVPVLAESEPPCAPSGSVSAVAAQSGPDRCVDEVCADVLVWVCGCRCARDGCFLFLCFFH